MNDNEMYGLLDSSNCDKHLYFIDDDGKKKRIDFILSYYDNHEKKPGHKIQFDRYLRDLRTRFGLVTKLTSTVSKEESWKAKEDGQEDESEVVRYVKIHAPDEVLYDAAEDLKMKMPTRPSDMKEWFEENSWGCGKVWGCWSKLDPFKVWHPETEPPIDYFAAPFDKCRKEEFLNHDSPEHFFSSGQRARLVSYILKQARFGTKHTDVGINQLIHKQVFDDFYPLHDGPVLKSRKEKSINHRQSLEKDWASIWCMFKYQPLTAIKDYFGEKLGLYFAWLGFYTTFLIPPAIVGIFCFIYGCLTTDSSPIVQESCSNPRVGSNNGTSFLYYMCPLCDRRCSYFLLNANCYYAKATHIFDNDSTIFFAVFMSIWATLFLEFWKRYQNELSYEWHSIGFKGDLEPDRPEYVTDMEHTKINPVTMQEQPYMPKSARLRKLFGSFSAVVFFICLVLCVIVGIIVFRAALSLALVASGNRILQESSRWIVATAAGTLNLLFINILKYFYHKVAVWLTDWENPRTQTQYDDSFTIKVFLFQFINTYSSVFYVAFLKGEWVTGSPGRYHRFGSAKFRMESCSYSGCFLELTIQLVIIMVGQQVFNNVIETSLPTLYKWWYSKKEAKDNKVNGITTCSDHLQWEEDYQCEPITKFSLFWEYAEIVLQYGFVTMFVAAFPLAPFFALLNNIIEIRIDAIKFIYYRRRPIAYKAEDIGAWYGILVSFTSFSVLVNAFVFAFTSEFIPRLVYRYQVSHNASLHGFVDWSLSSFNVRDFDSVSKPINATLYGIPVQDQCRYPGYRESSYPYDYNKTYWQILSIRLAFVLIFLIIISTVEWMVSYLVPDISAALELKIKRERLLASEADLKFMEKTHKRKRRPSAEKFDDLHDYDVLGDEM